MFLSIGTMVSDTYLNFRILLNDASLPLLMDADNLSGGYRSGGKLARSKMADITPFRALRYDFRDLQGDISDRVAPPYDILDQADKDRLLAGSDHNMVAIDLPHAPAKSVGQPHCYEKAGQTLKAWIKNATLVREDQPALYVYHQLFHHAEQRYTRRMFIARLKLEPFSEGTILPHEETFAGPKEDRLALMKATHANLSAVFGLYHDPADEVGKAFESYVERPPDAVATLEDVENRVWIVTTDDTIECVVRAFIGKKCYIGDGHHRYNTALSYREWASQQLGGELPAGHPANYVMVVLGSMDDPGSLILPTHRVLVQIDDLTLNQLVAAWAAGCEESSPEQADITLFHGATGRSKPLRFSNRGILASLEPDKSPAWCTLDVAYLHRYLLDELSSAFVGAGGEPNIRYVKAVDEAKRIAKDEHGIAVLCKAPTMAQLREVSEAGDLMPQKSTYFYPKVATGLTINPLQ